MYSLFNALANVHKMGILHRDVKPTNFLYDTTNHTGFLVDFGLAQSVDHPEISPPGAERLEALARQKSVSISSPISADGQHGYWVNDPRQVMNRHILTRTNRMT
jgi:cell division control protein 7